MKHPRLETSICERFGIELPIFGFSHSVEVVAAVCNSGGFGVYGATRRFPGEIADELAQIRRLVGKRPFGVDLVLPAVVPEANDREAMERQIPEEHRRFVAGLAAKYGVPKATGPGMRTRFVRSQEIAGAQVVAVETSDADLVAIGIGSPPSVIKRMKRRGKTTIALVGQEKHAARAIAAGVDILVAQGHDSGAHTGPIGTFTLVPRIVEIAGSTPVLAAGGVATGKHLVAALAMGAAGVWMGTAFLLTTENVSHLSPSQIKNLIAAGTADTVVTRAESGKTHRQNRSAWSDEWAASGAPRPLPNPQQDILVGDLLGAIVEHDIAPLAHIGAGQGIGWFDRIRPTADVVSDIVADAERALDRLAPHIAQGN